LDASVWLAALDADDDHHSAATHPRETPYSRQMF
jgi:predicted nucleic acid-binding protein